MIYFARCRLAVLRRGHGVEWRIGLPAASGEGLFPIVFFIMENNFPPDRIGDFTEVYFICVCISNLVAVGIFLQYNDSVFVKIGAQSGFVTEKIFTGNTIYGKTLLS